MAVFFMLVAEFGTDESALDEFIRYFKEEAEFVLYNGRKLELLCSRFQDEDGFWRTDIHPKGASYGSYTNKGELLSDYDLLDNREKEMTDLFLGLLKEAPPFRYAFVGCDREDHLLFHELAQEIKEDFSQGLIVSNELWEQLGRPARFVKFSEKYMWDPQED